ncbi:fumarate lyase (plasmid) [Xanthobacter versatilis]|uniref:Fumarate lyase n=1 Tax=Xanthobacter autotrophicus (strain ATCC BAA-1158 / Py2) TaxID=78245 RepID=A7IPY7_XANP2|nr:fumarate lyase [Xanthobacter autotrophicus Py2]
MTGWSFGSRIYGGAWSTPELQALFDDAPRTRRWLDLLGTLAQVEGEFGLIPEASAAAIVEACREVVLDDDFFARFAAGYRATGHSTAGLIDVIRQRYPEAVNEWFYFGATVQDVTDSWLMLALGEARALILADLDRSIAAATALCRDHRDTVMVGRTHGQQGLPITFGFKVAGWLAELRRHRRRFEEIEERMGIGQLCGGVGSLSALGRHGLEVQRAFCERVGLRPPLTSWTASRDVLVEWAQLLTLAAGTADRIGHEVYSLQRDEIGEVREGAVGEQIGSITMPHKRNPEIAEHLGTLSRVVRANTSALAESLPHDHERDGRSWKLEWHAVPELTMAGGKAVRLLGEMLSNLEVQADRMRANLDACDGRIYSEVLMLALAGKLGKQSAHRLVHQAAGRAGEERRAFREVVGQDPDIARTLTGAEIERVFNAGLQTAQCQALVDRVLAGGARDGAA